jgi:hypothetical protein
LRYLKYILILIIVFVVFFPERANSQRGRGGVENLPKFDKRRYHFGFLIGVNQMNFALKTVDNYESFDSLRYIKTLPQLGFNIGIVGSLRITDRLNFRFVPTLAFGDRGVQYEFVTKDGSRLIQTKRVESTFMDFPVYLKYKSRRLTNAQAFVLGGAKYSVDLASQAKKRNKGDDIPVKLRKSDYILEVGFGFDFFLPYFKMGTELKMSYGLRDLLYREDNIYNNSINRLNTKIFQFSLTFEG